MLDCNSQPDVDLSTSHPPDSHSSNCRDLIPDISAKMLDRCSQASLDPTPRPVRVPLYRSYACVYAFTYVYMYTIGTHIPWHNIVRSPSLEPLLPCYQQVKAATTSRYNVE